MIYQPDPATTDKTNPAPPGYVAVMASHGSKLHLISEKSWAVNRVLSKSACGHSTHRTNNNGSWIKFTTSDSLNGYEFCTRCLEAATKGVGRAVLAHLKAQRQDPPVRTPGSNQEY